MAQAVAGFGQDNAQADRTQRGPRGRWRPGVSGNPSGSIKSKRYLQLHAEIVADLGGDNALTGIDRVIIGQAVTLLIRAEKVPDTNIAVRAANTATRLLASLRNTKRRPRDEVPPRVPYRERLAAEFSSDD
jgi:hypothetical protein